MRTLQLARRFVQEDWGGTETVIAETSRRLQGLGHPTEVWCTTATAQSASDNYDGLRVRRFPYFYPYLGLGPEAKKLLDKKGGSPFSFSLMRAMQALPELDLIHLHVGNRIGGIGRHVARQRNIPYVITLHGGVFDVPDTEAATWTAPTKGAFDWGKLLGLWVGSRKVLQDASAVLCVGYPESVKAQQHLPHSKVVYFPNGADTRRFSSGDGAGFRSRHGIPQTAKVVLTLARIDAQKNQQLPVSVLPDLRRIEPNTHLLIVGSVTNGAYHEALQSMVKAQGLESAVTIVPGIPANSPELVNAYHAADLFLLPSLHEPFGIVILEAWSAGLPVIASNVGGVPHFVVDGEDALLFNPHDPSTLVKAYGALISDSGLAEKISAAGHKKALTQYDWDAITQKLIGVYEEVIRENSLRK